MLLIIEFSCGVAELLQNSPVFTVPEGIGQQDSLWEDAARDFRQTYVFIPMTRKLFAPTLLLNIPPMQFAP